MATQAGEISKVADAWMAFAAGIPLSAVLAGIDPEILRVMVHRVGYPCSCTVAGRTIMREHLRHVIRIRHLLKIRLMTLVTIGVLQLIVAIHMTCLACCGTMRSREREIRRRVIERRRAPRR